MYGKSEIVNLNVGGTRFSTSISTLTWTESFFSSLLSGRIASLRDDTGAYFIDRDPKLFSEILNYLRTGAVNIDMKCDMKALRALKTEAEFYSILPLLKRLALCEEISNSNSCGDILFYGFLPAAPIPIHSIVSKTPSATNSNSSTRVGEDSRLLPEVHSTQSLSAAGSTARSSTTHSRNASSNGGTASTSGASGHSRTHSRNPSCDSRHYRNSSGGDLKELTKYFQLSNLWEDPRRVKIVKASQNWLAVAFSHHITCYRLKDSSGWQLVWTSPRVDEIIDLLAINAKVGSTTSSSSEAYAKMVAITTGPVVYIWGVSEDGNRTDIGKFSLAVPASFLFFIGSQLVALSRSGKIGVWNSMTQAVLCQDLVPVSSFDTAGSFLLLGFGNGVISYIDMQKFPLRMQDSQMLVSELYRDPSGEPITAISVYLTPKTSISGNWLEIAYGVKNGLVRIIVQHPETVGHGPQLFQTFSVHRSRVTKVKLTEKHLVSVCSEHNHVRTWTLTRFRGMISSTPTTPLSSFEIISLEGLEDSYLGAGSDCCGPFGEQDDEQIFVQKVVPDTDELYVRLASNGKRICTIKSVDGTSITSFFVHELGVQGLGSRPRRFIFTGHAGGAIQLWDLTTALDLSSRGPATELGGPTPEELLRLLDQCDLTTSHASTPAASPCPSVANTSCITTSQKYKLKASNLAFLQSQTSASVENQSCASSTPGNTVGASRE